ncbi:hypothetical protein GCM10009817_20910 [Terrabacter lapilli]|uniref:DUF3293 domain-containing protein n=1 Tax=Terrabacter lapilli TaxID=436231 RepID=A0ABP5DJP7_9MICO
MPADPPTSRRVSAHDSRRLSLGATASAPAGWTRRHRKWRVGAAAGDAPAQAVHIVTAYNPHGRPATESDNRRAQRALVAQPDARNAAYHPAAGADPAWLHVEPSVAIVGLTRQEAVDLGWRFKQDAIFEWTADALTVVSCTDGATVALGWRQITPDARATGADRAWRELGLASPYVSIAAANTALNRALEAVDDQRAAVLNYVFLDFAADYWAPRVEAERMRESRRKEQPHEADRAAAAAARRAQERREKLRARQSEARRRHAAEHREHVEAGWPQAWHPQHVYKWLNLGGDLEGARRWPDEGLTPSAVLSAAGAIGNALALPIAVSDPAEVAWWGDTLTDIAEGTWPQVPASTRISVKRTFRDGRRERWFVLSEADGGVRVERWQASAASRPAAPDWTRTVVGVFPTTEAALEAVPELSTVSPDVVGEINAARDNGVDLLEHLRIPRAVDEHDQGLGVEEGAAQAARLERDEVARLVEGVPSHLVYCTVDGLPVVAVQTAHEWRRLTVGVDGIEKGGLVAEDVVQSRWSSESGEEPIVCHGGGSIKVVAPGLAVVRQWGDQGDGSEFVAWPTAVRGRAGVVARWIAESDLQTVAAILLEPWPDDEQWLVWYDNPIALDLALDDETRDALRGCLASDPEYARAREAVHDPGSRAGRALASALERASETRFTGDLYRLRWLSDDEEATR